jgi:AraC-like DNA-binding protein
MQRPAFTWEIPLETPPRVIRMAAASSHGNPRVEHYHGLHFWCLNLYEGEGELEIADQVLPIRPGCAGLTAPDLDIDYRYNGSATLTWAHFVFEEEGPTVPIAAMQYLGRNFEPMRNALREVCVLAIDRPRRAAVRLWDVLWQLAECRASAENGVSHPLVREAVQIIELRLAQPIYVSKLAAELNLSHTHLNRLFNAALGMPVQTYISRCRAERAHYLLTHSTLPIQTIAHQVGIPDAHLFNKTMRRLYGIAPRRIREQA